MVILVAESALLYILDFCIFPAANHYFCSGGTGLDIGFTSLTSPFVRNTLRLL